MDVGIAKRNNHNFVVYNGLRHLYRDSMNGSGRYKKPSRPAIFLDRDGTINKQVGHVGHPQKIELMPGAAQAIARINTMGYWCIVITNQSAVARGLASEDDVRRVNSEVALRVARESGGRIDGFYYCPHHESEGTGAYTVACNCRKPAPGMILAGAKDFNVLLEHSWMVGDGAIDHEAAKRASPSIRTILLPSEYHDGKGLADFYEDSLLLAVERIATTVNRALQS